MSDSNHEILELFAQQLHPLSATLQEMLNEHYSHQTERRGCGYTQATRVIAEFVNVPREANDLADLRIFNDYSTEYLKVIRAQGEEQGINDWHNLDINPAVQAYLAQGKNDNLTEALLIESAFQAKLRHIHEQATLEESKLICELLSDIILPKNSDDSGLISLETLPEKPKVGSCPMAEKFFLKIAHDQLLRQGIINIYTDTQNQAVMMEKINMGDNHSCISLKPLLMNGIRLPKGALFSIVDNSELDLQRQENKKNKGHIIPVQQVKFWFLRLTTLAVSPQNRERTFTTHFKQQIQNGLMDPEGTLLSQIDDIAKRQF
ncbi:MULTISPECIES: hypothetical protein [unclassified Acinetobacter]|uniref:hypothetical protein n=1 Tax=unclassified Acinetobacter TaxID=196816 RepID=UPI0035B97BF7